MKRQSKNRLGPLVEIADTMPRVALTFTNETIYLTRFSTLGEPLATYPVRSSDVANAFKLFGASTGILSPETLFWQARNSVLRIGIWLPPAVRALTFAQGKRAVTLQVPMPGFVFVGQDAKYSIWAATERPTKVSDRLYHAPLPNVHPNGLVCPGNVAFPRASTETIYQAAQLFWESHFNSDLSAGKIASQRNTDDDEADDFDPDEENQEYMEGEYNDPPDYEDYDEGNLVDEDTDDGVDVRHVVPVRNQPRRREPINLFKFLQGLKGKRQFPVRELVYTCTLKTVMEAK